MALLENRHPEDVKAAIRKRFGSMAAFERAERLSVGSVSEILRGRPSARTTKAVERVLREQANSSESIIPVDSASVGGAHRQNGAAN
jgi:lambda repressor-like predicted transcriptional regulator